jgi:uncharacterized protein (TIGR01319 family)
MTNKIEFLTVEIGSTITKVNGYALLPEARFLHLVQGFAPTSIDRGDVLLGYKEALAQLENKSGRLPANLKTFVNSSAAGGLRMTVHGLTYNMTARAAREAALGAGAIVKMVTAGLLDDAALDEIESINPNIVLLAGGVDFGEKDVILKNARALAQLHLHAPVVYAGNSAIRQQIQTIFKELRLELLIAENVFPEVDVLNTHPLRKVVHEVFNRHIIHAPGMHHLQEMTRGEIIPTPGAVLLGAELFAESCGDCLVFDVGGATTDVHSVTNGSVEWTSRQLEPEPYAKRTVEGDLGVYINARNIVDLHEDKQWESKLSFLKAIPRIGDEQALTQFLCKTAVDVGIRRHAGIVMETYTPTGKKQTIRGKDLTAVKWVIGTGGALTKIAGGSDILKSVCTGAGKFLLPPPDAEILLDKDYLFSSLGTLARSYPEEVKATFAHWVKTETIK